MPTPPGIISTSSSGAVSNVCVGVSVVYTDELSGFMAADVGAVVTGSRVSAMKAMEVLWIEPMNWRMSTGP